MQSKSNNNLIPKDMDNVDKKVVGTLSSIPFENIIGGPLSACIKAQEEAAVSTVNFIKSVGLTQEEDGSVKAVYVVFSYIQNGRKVNLSVPLLTIVPIPYIAIHNIDIDFKVAVSGVEQDSDESSFSKEYHKDTETSSKKGGGWLTKKKTSKMKTSISTKRDSKSTSESRFSIEATLDVSVHAGQESMPAGMSKILEMLGNAVDVVSVNGELSYDGPFESNENKYIVVRYKSPEGIFLTEGITCDKATSNGKNEEGDALLFYFNKDTAKTRLTLKQEGKEDITKDIDLS